MSQSINEVQTKAEPKVLYQVVNTKGWELVTYEELVNKYEITGVNKKMHNRIEIQGKPVLADYYGPMYNGVNDKGQLVVRYESRAAYDMYSR